MTKQNKTVNIKLDNETKTKLEALAFLERQSLQDLCFKIITTAINENKERIENIENLRK